MESCDHCIDYSEHTKIKNPADLTEMILKIQKGLDTNILQKVEILNNMGFAEFHHISPEGPWPDVVLNRFQCKKCAQKFELIADTYHGSQNNGWYINQQF